MSRPFRKSAFAMPQPPASPTRSDEEGDPASPDVVLRVSRVSRTEMPDEITGCCGMCDRWKRVQAQLSVELPAYLMLNRRVGQLMGWQLSASLLMFITSLVANNEFDASYGFTTPFLGSTLLNMLWVDFVFHASAGGFGFLLWWRRWVLKGYLLFLYYLGSLGEFLLVIWTLSVTFSGANAVFDQSKNYGDERPIFSWVIILYMMDGFASLMFLIGLVRYWREMESEALGPPKSAAVGGRVAADVLAAHGIAMSQANVFQSTHASPKKKKEKRVKPERPKVTVSSPPPKPGYNLDLPTALETGSHAPKDLPESKEDQPGRGFDSEPPRAQVVHAPPLGVPTSSTPVSPGPAAFPTYPEARVVETPVVTPPPKPQATATASPPPSLPPIAAGPAAIQSLTPPQFEAMWTSMPESGAFDCGVSIVPEKFALLHHLETRGFRVVATGVVEGNLKVYFYGTGATMVAAGQGSNALKPATVFLAEFLFDGASQRLSAKFKCSDDAATGTFVRRFRLQNLFSVTADPGPSAV